MNSEVNYSQIAKEIGELLQEKDKAYGSAFAKIGDFLRILYPNGIQPEQYVDALMLTRIFDKLMRIAHQKDAFDESPYRDIAGYAILGLANDLRSNSNAVESNEF